MRRILALSFIAVFFIAAKPLKPPAAKRVPVTDTYGSVSVTEDYRWLENANDPAVQKWSESRLDIRDRFSMLFHCAPRERGAPRWRT